MGLNSFTFTSFVYQFNSEIIHILKDKRKVSLILSVHMKQGAFDFSESLQPSGL